MSDKKLAGFPQTINISTMTFVKAVLIVFLILFLWLIRDIVAMFLVALLLAALIDPFADMFVKVKIPRGIAVLILYVILGTLVSLISILVIPVVIEQSIQLVTNLSVYFKDAAEWVGKFQTYSMEHGFGQNIESSIQSFQQSFSSSFSSLFTTIQGFFGGIISLFIILVLTFYMVVEENSARKYFKHLAPVEYQPFISQILVKMKQKIGAWLRGQIILGLIIGVAVYIGLKLIGVEYALLLALIAGIMEIIPFVGPIIALVPAVIIGFAQSPLIGVLVLVLYIIIQQIENNILVPKIMQKVTGLSPLISIAALLVGIKIGGLAGAILAIPVATMISVVLEELFKE